MQSNRAKKTSKTSLANRGYEGAGSEESVDSLQHDINVHLQQSCAVEQDSRNTGSCEVIIKSTRVLGKELSLPYSKEVHGEENVLCSGLGREQTSH